MPNWSSALTPSATPYQTPKPVLPALPPPVAPTPTPAGGLASLAPPAPVVAPAPAMGTTNAMLGAYTLPDADAAAAKLRKMQMQATGGLNQLMKQDTTAQRKEIEDAMYSRASEGVNTAADRARQTMLEGTFGRGVGPSSMTVELAGRGQQEHADALSRAALDAYLGAGAEQRLDRASLSDLYNAALAGGTTGLQGEANVALSERDRLQREDQFARDLGFQGQENALDRTWKSGESKLTRDWTTGESALDRALTELLQQNEFGFKGGQADADRAAAAAAQASAQGFASGESALDRALRQSMLASEQAYGSTQSAADRELARWAQTDRQDYSASQSAADRELARWAQTDRQDYSTGQSALDRELARATETGRQTYGAGQSALDRAFTGTQNEQSRQDAMDRLLLQLASDRETATGNQIIAGVGAGASGLAGLLSPWLREWLKPKDGS